MQDDQTAFYGSCGKFKQYRTPVTGSKQRKRFDQSVWEPGQCQSSHRFLEIGCGTGPFLDYLHSRGCSDFLGIDHDPALAEVISATARPHFRCADVWQALSDPQLGMFDRIVALDVLEHFRPDDALRLMGAANAHLNPGGRIIIRVPNASSPWGLQHQYGDLTHCTGYTPSAFKQLAEAADLAFLGAMPVRFGSRRRIITDKLVERFLTWALVEHPDVWTANMVGVFAKR